MLIWVVLAGLTAIVLFVLLRPLAGTGSNDRTPDAFDAAVYRDQLSEIDSDRARGLIGEEEAEAARVEVARRLLAADSKARASEPAEPVSPTSRTAMIAVGASAAVCSRSAFISPLVPPACPTSRSPPGSKIPPATGISKLWSRAPRRGSGQHPDEGEGWEVIAPVYLSWQRYADAADAYAQAIKLLGPSAKRLSGQGQALVLANNGVVTEDGPARARTCA